MNTFFILLGKKFNFLTIFLIFLIIFYEKIGIPLKNIEKKIN
jgi:hypothetical protein